MSDVYKRQVMDDVGVSMKQRYITSGRSSQLAIGGCVIIEAEAKAKAKAEAEILGCRL